MMGWDGPGLGWGGWLLMSLGMVLFWALVIGLLVAFLRAGRDGWLGPRDGRRSERRDGSTTASSAEEVLAERYARGEIDGEEYQRRLEVLRGRHGPTNLTKNG